jgi:hypothetical protein
MSQMSKKARDSSPMVSGMKLTFRRGAPPKGLDRVGCRGPHIYIL